MASAMEGQVGLRKRDLSSAVSVGTTTLSLGAIVGIATGGALLLFTVLVAIGVIHVKKKHRREKAMLMKGGEDANADIDLKTALRSTRPSGVYMGRRASFNPFLSVPQNDNREEWNKQDGLQKPPVAKSRFIQRGFFRTSSVRDSWPLSNRPLGFLPGQSNMVLSPVASPGYVLQDPKWPSRTTSLMGRKNSQGSSKTISPSRDPYQMDVMPYRKIHRRSTSETQLSTILRSTSQRLKAAPRISLTRTSSTLGQFPGLPPSERLPTPPMRIATESREGLIDQDNAESVGSSIYDVYTRTPSPEKKHQRRFSKLSPARPQSPTESVESKDSLCVSDNPDEVIPVPLTSPSKSPARSNKRSSVVLSGAKDISALINQDTRASLFATGPHDSINDGELFSPLQRIVLSGDPFYSSVGSPKTTIPSPQIQGPRPMYLRKATFGPKASPGQPDEFGSPLGDVTASSRPSSKRELPEPPTTSEPNPFQWLPQDAMQTLATQKGHHKRSTSKLKGHKRSNFVRMSNLSRPTSAVDMVPEEPEEFLKFTVPKCSSFRSLDLLQDTSPTKSPASRRTSQRPPSIATFNPTVTVPAVPTLSDDKHITLSSKGVRGNGYSPTLSVCNYYTDKDSGSEDEFFKSQLPTSLQPSPSVLKARRHGRNYSSADLDLFPTHQSQQYHQERLLSFPPLPVDVLPTIASSPAILTPRPTSRPLPNITSAMDGLRSSAATPAPPILTVPANLSGPLSEPEKLTQATLSPPHGESMLNTITKLRRMNSEVSTVSFGSMASLNSPLQGGESPNMSTSELGLDNLNDDGLEIIKPLDINTNQSTSVEERGRSRGSQHYLALRQSSPNSSAFSSARHRSHNKARQGRHARPEFRDSHRIYKERRQKRTEELEGAGMVDELEAVEEVNGIDTSPGSAKRVNLGVRGNSTGSGTRSGNAGLKFPTLTREGRVGFTSSRDRERGKVSGLRLSMGVNDTNINDENSNENENKTVLPSIETDTEAPRVLGEKSGNAGLGLAQARWSDAMSKPTTVTIRRESKMEHPTPLTPPKWGAAGANGSLSGLGLAGVRLLEKDAGSRVGFGVGDGEENAEGTGRPNSLGLYDQEGFLKGSPERENGKKERISGFVM